MSRIVGIDLGTTNSLVAAVDSGIPFVIPDQSGQRLTPSVVHFPGPPLGPVVGREAVRSRVVRPDVTLYSVKRFMGRRGGELDPEERRMPYTVQGSGGQAVGFEVHGQRLLPEEVSAQVLLKLKGDAETYFNEPIERAVITVPAYFNDAQRNATKAAGELAGLTVERILNEPTAAALAYGVDRLHERARVAVYDLGGGTFDLSILELRDGVFQVLSTSGNTRLGGDDLDQRVFEFLAGRVVEKGGPDARENPAVRARLRQAAEEAKIQLSSALEAQVSLPFLTSSFSFDYRMTRAELEDLTRDILGRTRPHCIRALADARLEAKDLDQIILVGGQTRMPLVRNLVTEIFHCADFEGAAGGIRVGSEFHRAEGPMLNTSQNPDEAVALGAAIQAEILSGGFKNLLLLDVTPLSLGMETFGGLMNVVIPRNSTIPIKAGEVFTTAVNQQREMLIRVLQGERERARDNWSLGQFTLEFDPAPKGVARVGVQFEIDANGILNVLARDLKTGREKVVPMNSAVDVNDADVQRMVEESVEHAFDDLRSRRWIEAKLRATDVISATRQALNTARTELEESYIEKVLANLKETEEAIATEDPNTSTGDLERLKSSVDALDLMTAPLAELLMDRAMEAMLRKRGVVT